MTPTHLALGPQGSIAAAPARALIDPQERTSVVGQVAHYMPRLVGAALVVAFIEGIGGLVLGEPALLASTALTAGFGLILLHAGYLLRSGRDRWVGPLLAVSIYLVGLCGAILIPGAARASAMLPVLSVVLILPGRSRRGIMTILAVALAGSALTLLIADLPHVFPPMQEPLASMYAMGTVLGVALLILGALTDFAIQAKESLERMRRAMEAQEAASSERTAIVASLGRLERLETIEATADGIVDALIRLPGVDLAGVLACRGRNLEVLALSGPPGFPVGPGDLLPTARARELIERLQNGPWSERWANDPVYESYGDAFTASGIIGQAYAPFFDDAEMIGVIAIGTQSAAHADHLIADLPAVAEFAWTTALLLAPLLIERREMASAREAIQEIITSAGFRPVFQPVVELASGRTVGYEALTRFSDGRRPDHVFAFAAQAGLGLELELRTLEVAIKAGRRLPPGTWLSLNVSPQLVVAATGLERVLAGRDRPVVLEITEHVAIDDYRAVRSAVDRLGPGVRIAVDDAGAGIANFSHLVELRPRLVKVDAGLIRDLDTDLARQAAVVGLVHFSARSGCEVIAEGIETEAERATAYALGVTHGQGFLIARPAAVDEFTSTSPAITPLRVAAIRPAILAG